MLAIAMTTPRLRCLRDASRHVRHTGAARVPFEPGINPFRFDPNGASSANARMTQLATFAGGVNGVAADARMRRTL